MQNQNNTGIVEFGHIALENVFFAYPARPNEFVIRDLNLIIPRGKTIALIGKSGGGKSTIFSLLQRFYDPCSGSIKISESNDSNLKNLDVLRYRNGIGIVSQDPILFTGTIKSNIAYCAQGDVSDEDIKEAAVLANAHSFIEEFPQKYETEVGERGVQLSGM
jgi:ATP-binding cassette subfamily B (MDR/TAP) protein 1